MMQRNTIVDQDGKDKTQDDADCVLWSKTGS